MTKPLSLFLVCAVAAEAGAAAVVFDVNTNTGSDPVLYSITVNDDTTGLLTFAVDVAAASVNNADVVALYFDFDVAGATAGYSASDFFGAPVTKVKFNSSNAQAGNIGQVFQFALAIGTPGASGDFYDSFTFSMNIRNGLTLGDLALFGVRGQSVGAGSTQADPGEGSSKTFVEPGEPQSPPVPVPLPSAAGLAIAGLALTARRRRPLA